METTENKNSTKVCKRLTYFVSECSKTSFQAHKVGARVPSPTFEIVFGETKTKWSFLIFLNGKNKKFESNISFHLRLDSAEPSMFEASFALGILCEREEFNYTDTEWSLTTEENYFLKKTGYGTNDLISHEDLFGEYNHLIDNGGMTFFCDLTLKPSEDNSSSSSDTFVEGFGKMFEKDFLTDIEMKTSDNVILKAHKAILAARSPEFLKLFKNNMKECSVLVLNFDSVIIKIVLCYIYCQEMENVNEETLHKVLDAANEYDIVDLKEKCVSRIIFGLSTKNVLKSLEIAHRIKGTNNLFSDCVDLIIRNSDTISKTDDWEKMPQDLSMIVILEMAERLSAEPSENVSPFIQKLITLGTSQLESAVSYVKSFFKF